MAKATAYCKCGTCGTEFTRTANKGLRAEADSWALWAADHYTECPACYAKRMRSEESKNPITALVGLDTLNAQIVISITGNTRPVKDALRSRGYRWDVPFETGLSGILDMGTRFMRVGTRNFRHLDIPLQKNFQKPFPLLFPMRSAR